MSQSQQAVCTNRMLRLAFERMIDRVTEQMKEDFHNVLEDIESQLLAEDQAMEALMEITDEDFNSGISYINESLAPADQLDNDGMHLIHLDDDYEDVIDTVLESPEIPASSLGIDLDGDTQRDDWTTDW
jgi:hypothetical protein